MTTEQSRKNQARKLINMPVANRPSNVHYKPATRFDHEKYMVEIDEIGVYFMRFNSRLTYLGEYPVENWG